MTKELKNRILENKVLTYEERMEIVEALEQQPSNSLCDSCINIGCEFQSGIVRTECAFYMPPHIEPDNCGNYVVMQPTVQAIPLDKFKQAREEIEQAYGDFDGYDPCALCWYSSRVDEILDRLIESED